MFYTIEGNQIDPNCNIADKVQTLMVTYFLYLFILRIELTYISQFITMVKRQTRNTIALNSKKGKQKKLQPQDKHRKRGRKTRQEVLTNLLETYSIDNSSQVRQEIRGWKREIQTDEEDNEAEEEIMDFITDPGNIRGRLSLFHQTVHTYWIVKCLLAKAMQSFHLH